MRAIRTLFGLVVLSIAAVAQSKPDAAAEQRFFNIEDAVKHPEILSANELAALAQDDLMRTELQGKPVSKLTQEGLEVTVVHLCGTTERDLVVIGDGESYAGANLGPFWIIRDLPAGPVVVLGEVSLGLSVQTKRTNKCLNLQAVAATAAESTTTDFSFNGEQYVVSRKKSEKLAR